MQDNVPGVFTDPWSTWPHSRLPSGQNLPVPNAPPSSGFPYMPEPSVSQQSGADVSGAAMQADTPKNNQLMDMGMIASGESRMDEQWISFMRESGLVDFNHSQNHPDTAYTSNAYSLGNRVNPQGSLDPFW